MKRALFLFALLAACKSSSTPATADPVSTTAQPQQPAAPTAAAIGAPAPDFELTDTEGKTHKLSSFKGKRVVLEWFNPGCPFVKASHTKASLKDFPKTAIGQGVVWLAINSGAPGKQGHGVEANREGKTKLGVDYPVLLDPDGKVGKLYSATNTPHMYVVDEKGVLVYRGAIDNSPDGDGTSPDDGKLVNHVEMALADLAAGNAVRKAETKAYGCSVKYGSH
jgi:peroxiredoxin